MCENVNFLYNRYYVSSHKTYKIVEDTKYGRVLRKLIESGNLVICFLGMPVRFFGPPFLIGKTDSLIW